MNYTKTIGKIANLAGVRTFCFACTFHNVMFAVYKGAYTYMYNNSVALLENMTSESVQTPLVQQTGHKDLHKKNKILISLLH